MILVDLFVSLSKALVLMMEAPSRMSSLLLLNPSKTKGLAENKGREEARNKRKPRRVAEAITNFDE